MHIRFGFKNAGIIKLLQKRGSQLRSASFDFKEVQKVEQEICQYKNEHYEELVHPVHAFVLFSHELAKQTALKKTFSSAFSSCGTQLELKRAQHPTTILWQNL